MSTSKEQRDALKATLKKLRDERGAAVDAAVDAQQAAAGGAQAGARRAGRGTGDGPRAGRGHRPAHQDVLWHVAAMRKYGDLVEAGMDGDYCTYSLVAEAGGSDA